MIIICIFIVCVCAGAAERSVASLSDEVLTTVFGRGLNFELFRHVCSGVRGRGVIT